MQEEVLERAKEMAAREAMEAQGAVPKPSTPDVSAVINGDATTNLSSATDAATLVMSPSSYSLTLMQTQIRTLLTMTHF